MKISMWILADWLQEYHPKCSIESGECNLQYVRLFGNEKELDLSTAYLCEITSFIETAKTGVMCVNRNDYIYLETFDVIDVFNKIMQAFDYYNVWEHELEQLIVNGKSIQDMIMASSQIFKNPVIVGDAAYRVLALDPNPDKYIKNIQIYQRLQEYGCLSIREINLINQEQVKHRNRRSPYFLKSQNLPGTDGIVRNLFANRRSRFGMVILKDENGFTEGEIQLFDKLGGFLEKWMKKNVPAATVPALAQLFIELICQNYTDLNKNLELLAGNGWDPNGEKRLIVIEPCQKSSNSLNYLENYFTTEFKDCCVFSFNSGLVLLEHQTSKGDAVFYENLKRHLILSECFCGVSYSFSSLPELKNHYDEACVALKYGSEAVGAINYCEAFLLPYVKDIIKKHASCDISLPALEQLKYYDRKYCTDYYNTLYLYLVNERNKVKTSKELHIHRNTLLHRLEKIEEIITMDLDVPENRFELLVSYIMKQ